MRFEGAGENCRPLLIMENAMKTRETIPLGWVLAAIAAVTLLFNGIALVLPVPV